MLKSDGLMTFPFKLAPYTTQKLLGINKWIFLRTKLVLIYSRIRFSLASVLASRQGPASSRLWKTGGPGTQIEFALFATRCLQAPDYITRNVPKRVPDTTFCLLAEQSRGKFVSLLGPYTRARSTANDFQATSGKNIYSGQDFRITPYIYYACMQFSV